MGLPGSLGAPGTAWSAPPLPAVGGGGAPGALASPAGVAHTLRHTHPARALGGVFRVLCRSCFRFFSGRGAAGLAKQYSATSLPRSELRVQELQGSLLSPGIQLLR